MRQKGIKQIRLYQAVSIFTACILFAPISSFAAQWKSLCTEGGVCELGPFYAILDPHSARPPVTRDGFLLHYTPISYSEHSRRELLLGHAGNYEKFGFIENRANSYASDQNTIELPSGKKLNFSLYTVALWDEPHDEIEYRNWSGMDALNLNGLSFTGPPVFVDGSVFVGIWGAGQYIYFSEDEGVTWKRNRSSSNIGDDRYNLVANPEGTALWAISSDYIGPKSRLRESTDQGATWVYVDDGSFPANTMRVVHDPEDSLVSYALTDKGLFVSENRGVTWQASSLTQAIHSLIFISREAPESRAIVIGTDSGVMVSTDEMVSWQDMSDGLLAQPHSVTHWQGQLVANSDSGYFECTLLDCMGGAQVWPPEEERGTVEVVEFYNTDLNHYFITGTEVEADLIDEGAAGPGWIRTGVSFLAWSLGGNLDATDVCRFYGSIHPGPNSHFYSVSTSECRFLMDLQELIPEDQPRWNFEGYAFSILPPSTDEQMPCPESMVPVYRAYNDAFRRGEDSNHRYMTDAALVAEMVSEGWIDEGVAFCSPAE